jgi:hypothetical protein
LVMAMITVQRTRKVLATFQKPFTTNNPSPS